MCVFNFLKDTSREKDWRCLSISKKKQFSERKGKGAIPFCGIISSISRDWNCTYLVFSSCQSLLYSWHELCTLGKCPAEKCPFGKVSFGELFVGEIFVRRVVRLGKCPLGNYPSGKSPSVECPSANDPRTLFCNKRILENLLLVSNNF